MKYLHRDGRGVNVRALVTIAQHTGRSALWLKWKGVPSPRSLSTSSILTVEASPLVHEHVSSHDIRPAGVCAVQIHEHRSICDYMTAQFL